MPPAAVRHPEVSTHRRNAARVTSHEVLHPLEKQQLLRALPLLRRRAARSALEARWREEERLAQAEAKALVGAVSASVEELAAALDGLAALQVPALLGKVEIELHHVRTAAAHLDVARAAVESFDFGTAGAAVEECD